MKGLIYTRGYRMKNDRLSSTGIGVTFASRQLVGCHMGDLENELGGSVMRPTCVRKVFPRVIILLIVATLITPPPSFGYGAFTHEAIIEVSWKTTIVPALLKRFPNATEEQLQEARSYAFGGALIQDMGYFPFLNKFFSDLLHYVRTGDFIEELIRQSSDLNEYAFALGAMEHYAGDSTGHPVATNRSIPIYYPKLQKKYGDVITYEQKKSAHSQTELGFDVVEVAAKVYRGDIYSSLIEFNVPNSLLQRAFKTTYGLDLKELFDDLDSAIEKYQRTLTRNIPRLTMVAWKLKKDEIIAQNPQITDKDFVYRYTIPKERREQAGRQRKSASAFDNTLGFLAGILIKFHLLKPLNFRVPTKETEKLFQDGILATRDLYKKLLADAENGTLKLENLNLDTGRLTRPAEYRLADATYAKLLEKLEKDHFRGVTPELRANILAFYADPTTPVATKFNKEQWKTTMRDLEELKAMTKDANRATE